MKQISDGSLIVNNKRDVIITKEGSCTRRSVLASAAPSHALDRSIDDGNVVRSRCVERVEARATGSSGFPKGKGIPGRKVADRALIGGRYTRAVRAYVFGTGLLAGWLAVQHVQTGKGTERNRTNSPASREREKEIRDASSRVGESLEASVE